MHAHLAAFLYLLVWQILLAFGAFLLKSQIICRMNKYLIADQKKTRHKVWVCRCHKMTKRPIYPWCNITEVNEFDLYVENPISHLNGLYISELCCFVLFWLALALVGILCRIRYSHVTFTHAIRLACAVFFS